MEKIRYEDWPRREAYELFSAVSHPFYSVTFTVDVTDLYEYVKREGLSFYYGLVYLCTQAVNETPDFLHVIRDGEIFRLDERMPSFTDLAPGAEQFHVVTMPAAGTIGEFCRRAREVSRGQTKFIDGEAETDELIYFSCRE